MANDMVNTYQLADDGSMIVGTLPTGEEFYFDAEDFPLISATKWYRCNKSSGEHSYVGDSNGVCMHRVIMGFPQGSEIDHINLNPLDNRRSNLRICTHQQNQCNQPLQRNNVSGVTGVSFYPPRKKYRARIKYFQRELHLGYYPTFVEAVQARNEGMRILFGEYGRYNDVPPTPPRIRDIVRSKCSRFLTGAAFSCRKQHEPTTT
ncbi:HNH endonuclease [Trueperella pecoris]|nr:HNH endonuclease [Trueperella pecoris]